MKFWNRYGNNICAGASIISFCWKLNEDGIFVRSECFTVFFPKSPLMCLFYAARTFFTKTNFTIFETTSKQFFLPFVFFCPKFVKFYAFIEQKQSDNMIPFINRLIYRFPFKWCVAENSYNSVFQTSFVLRPPFLRFGALEPLLRKHSAGEIRCLVYCFFGRNCD